MSASKKNPKNNRQPETKISEVDAVLKNNTKGDEDLESSRENLLLLWKTYNDQVNSIDGRLTVSVSIAFGAFTFASYFTRDIIIFLPLFAVVFLFYLSYQLRIIEILRGYLCYIERRLIQETKENAFSWNSFGVMKNYNVKYFRAQKYAIRFYLVFLGGGAVLSAVTTFVRLLSEKCYWEFVAYCVYLLACIIFAILFVSDMRDNRYVSETVQTALRENNISTPPELVKHK